MAKTNIYIDGYNLYYSRLKNTPFKWLDLPALFRDQIMLAHDPDADVVCIKYFTAPIKAAYAQHGRASEHAQTQYQRALLAKYPDLIQVIEPRNGSWTHMSVRFWDFLARRDDDAGFTLRGGATQLGRLKIVQSYA